MTGDPREGLRRLREAAESGDPSSAVPAQASTAARRFGSSVAEAGHPRDLDIAVAFSGQAKPDVISLISDLVRITGTEGVDLIDPAGLGRLPGNARL